jgi:DNA-binding NarL/FixJ family response regulator
MSPRSRIGIVEDHRMVAESLAAQLSESHDIVGIAHDSAQALRLATDMRPDIFLLDISLGEENGLALISQLLEIVPGAAFVVVTNFGTAEFQEFAQKAGALGFISKGETTAELLRTISCVARGESCYSTPARTIVYVPSRLDTRLHLSSRQVEVLQHLACGLTYKEISRAIGVSENTVDLYIRRIRTALGGHKGADLVRRGFEHGFLPRGYGGASSDAAKSHPDAPTSGAEAQQPWEGDT